MCRKVSLVTNELETHDCRTTVTFVRVDLPEVIFKLYHPGQQYILRSISIKNNLPRKFIPPFTLITSKAWQ